MLDATGGVPPRQVIEMAVAVLRTGAVVGVPTDTVYGVAVDPSVPGACRAVFAVKDRPKTVELPVLVAGDDQLEGVVGAVPDLARRLMDRYWPGPLTIILRRRPGLDWDLGGDGATIGVRCPAHPVPLALCRAGGPLATTSANRHGEPPLTVAGQLATLRGVALVLDAGVCAGTPSTVVDCTGERPRLRRAGGVPSEDLAALTGWPWPLDSSP